MDEPADLVLVEQLRAGLRPLADPGRAEQMRAYMKSAMPYLGVRVPQVRALVRATLRARPVSSTPVLHGTVRTLWYGATFREERYLATELLGAPSARDLREPVALDLVEELIVDGAWWDHTDELAHRVGELLRAFPTEIRPRVLDWRVSPDRWLRRAAVICQLGHRRHTDLDLLTTAIEANTDDADVFVRKAIGWALRDYARVDPDWVRSFVHTHALSALSVREATKHL